jgi:hypothetical protein
MKLVKKSIPITTAAQMQKLQMMTANLDLNDSAHSTSSIQLHQQQQQQKLEEEEDENGGDDGDDATTNEIQYNNEKLAMEQHSPAPAEDSGYHRYARRLSC